MQKIVFIDVDGVLNDEEFLQQLAQSEALFAIMDRRYRTVEAAALEIDPVKVKVLNAITRATGAQLVVSSTWRHTFAGMDVERMRLLFSHVGIKAPVVGLTRWNAYQPDTREQEILSWVRLNKLESWCAIDDMTLSLGPRFVQCDFEEGLRPRHLDGVEKALAWRDRHKYEVTVKSSKASRARFADAVLQTQSTVEPRRLTLGHREDYARGTLEVVVIVGLHAEEAERFRQLCKPVDMRLSAVAKVC